MEAGEDDEKLVGEGADEVGEGCKGIEGPAKGVEGMEAEGGVVEEAANGVERVEEEEGEGGESGTDRRRQVFAIIASPSSFIVRKVEYLIFV
ncbi:uncharacterized protein A4U43_C08F28850 [Asparagus officinalis]|nr:uncharacterized protein A4U43_C08F28850 [Asparagus officinalis]